MHCLEMSLREIGSDGKVIPELNIGSGKGPRLCMEANICRSDWANGFLVCKDDNGDFVKDCAYINAKGDEVEKFGRFVELNNFGQPRDIFSKSLEPPTKKSRLYADGSIAPLSLKVHSFN